MSFLKKCQDQYQELWQAIIRPPRDEYEIEHLGPKKFKIQNKQYKRIDLMLKNSRNLKLECSWFTPTEMQQATPCVIYLHGNCSSRLETLPYLDLLLPLGITLFCFDFAGSGKSDGEYISLGYYERYDIQTVIAYLRSTNLVTTIGLWGRSMGAATSLMFAEMDSSVAGIVVDSAFASLRQLAGELSKMYMKRLPGMFVGAGLKIVGVTIKKKAGFNVSELRPIAHVKKAFVPALFIAATEDTFIDPKHTHRLYNDYSGEKKLMLVEGDHNSTRPQEALDSIAIFFFNVLQCHQLNGSQKILMDQQFKDLGLTNKANNNNNKNNNKEIIEQLEFDDEDYEDDDDYEQEWQDMEGFDQAELQQAIKESLKVSNNQKCKQFGADDEEEDFFNSILAYSKNKEKLQSKINNNKTNESNSDSNDDQIFDFFDNQKTQSTPKVTQSPGQTKTTQNNQMEDFFDFPFNNNNNKQQQQQQQMQQSSTPYEQIDLLSFDYDEQKQQNQQTPQNDYFEDSLI